jgi:hypothetical protein
MLLSIIRGRIHHSQTNRQTNTASLAMMFDVNPDLRRYVSATFFVSAGVGVFGVLFLILGLTGVHGSAKGPSWPFVIFGVVAILSDCVGMTIVPRQHRYASRVVASVTATPQRIVLELESDSDSTSLYATPIDSTARQRARRLGLLLPVWSVQSLLGKLWTYRFTLIRPRTNRSPFAQPKECCGACCPGRASSNESTSAPFGPDPSTCDPFLCRTSSTNVSASEELRGYG